GARRAPRGHRRRAQQGRRPRRRADDRRRTWPPPPEARRVQPCLRRVLGGDGSDRDATQVAVSDRGLKETVREPGRALAAYFKSAFTPCLASTFAASSMAG